MKKNGEEPYPHKFNVTISLENFIEKFSSLTETQILYDEEYSVAGMFYIYKNNGGSCKIKRNMIKKFVWVNGFVILVGLFDYDLSSWYKSIF